MIVGNLEIYLPETLNLMNLVGLQQNQDHRKDQRFAWNWWNSIDVTVEPKTYLSF